MQGPVQAGADGLWGTGALLVCVSAKSCLLGLLPALAASQTHAPMHQPLSSTLKVMVPLHAVELQWFPSVQGDCLCGHSRF